MDDLQNLDWGFNVLAIVALVLAIIAMPSVAQMFWGKGRLVTEYKTDASGSDRSLIVFLSNPPVRRWFLKGIGVTRVAIQSLEASFRISEAGGGVVLDPIRHARFHSPDDPSDEHFSYRVVLPPTYSVGTSLMIAIWDSSSRTAVVLPDRLRPAFGLHEGLYDVEVLFLVDGHPHKESRRFKVGQSADDLMWV